MMKRVQEERSKFLNFSEYPNSEDLKNKLILLHREETELLKEIRIIQMIILTLRVYQRIWMI
jgi:hypothetical protein